LTGGGFGCRAGDQRFLQIYMKAYIRDELALKLKIRAMKKDGAKNLQIVTDFDRTLTPAKINGQHAPTSAGILETCGYMPEKYVQRASELFAIYFAKEIDPNIGIPEKIILMNEWMDKNMENMIENSLKYDDLKKIIETGKMILRDGVEDCLEMAYLRSIPVVIFSAGIGDLITATLNYNRLFTANIHIISNFFRFAKNGRVTGFAGETINVFQKNEVKIEGKYFYNEIKERRNVLLIGDGLGDAGMADGIRHDNVIKIGLRNDGTHADKETYLERFDIVLEGDGKFHYINDLLAQLIS
jgi:HAD superfamily hydrolase (TIGR01544 family)